MSALEKHMAALIAQLPPVWEEIAGIKRRIDRIEKQLELGWKRHGPEEPSTG